MWIAARRRPELLHVDFARIEVVHDVGEEGVATHQVVQTQVGAHGRRRLHGTFAVTSRMCNPGRSIRSARLVARELRA